MRWPLDPSRRREWRSRPDTRMHRTRDQRDDRRRAPIRRRSGTAALGRTPTIACVRPRRPAPRAAGIPPRALPPRRRLVAAGHIRGPRLRPRWSNSSATLATHSRSRRFRPCPGRPGQGRKRVAPTRRRESAGCGGSPRGRPSPGARGRAPRPRQSRSRPTRRSRRRLRARPGPSWPSSRPGRTSG